MIELQRKERCVQRAVWLMALVVALAGAGLCYWAVFVTDHPRNMSGYVTPFISKGFCEVGLGALICLVAFIGLGMIYRKQLERQREECRQMATRFLESHPPSTPPSAPAVKEQSPKTNKQIERKMLCCGRLR